MTTTATRTDLLESLRHSRSLAIDAGKDLERCRDHYFRGGNHKAAADLVLAKHQFMAVIDVLNALLAAESERCGGQS